MFLLKLIASVVLYMTICHASFNASNESEILQTYGKNNLSKIESFKGDYINFGYWKDICITKEIVELDRIKASENLYSLIIQELGDCNSKNVIEVGCGIGNGCVLLHNKFSQAKILGIDLTPEQIDRAQYKHATYLKQFPMVNYKVARCDDTKLADDSMDLAYSVEAAQYFPSISSFAQEMTRVLKQSGRLVVTAHFSTSVKAYEKVKTMLPTVRDGIDLMIPISVVRQAFQDNGFKEVEFYPIGHHVFPGFDKWVSQGQDADWVKNINIAFKNGLINYYILIMENSK